MKQAIEYNVESWLLRTGCQQSDTDEMVRIFYKWLIESSCCPVTGQLDEDLLLNKLSNRIKAIHSDPADHLIITALLTIQMANLAKSEQINAPKLTRMIH